MFLSVNPQDPVSLRAVQEFDNDQHTFYIEVLQPQPLNEARRRLYDGRFLKLPELREWSWHITAHATPKGTTSTNYGLPRRS
jgi:hypothetical protein